MSEHPFRVTIPSSGSTDYLRRELERCLALWFPEATVEAIAALECELCGEPWSGAGPVCDQPDCGGTIINTTPLDKVDSITPGQQM